MKGNLLESMKAVSLKPFVLKLAKSFSLGVLLAGLSGVSVAQSASQTLVKGDYHLSLYNDMYGDVQELEAYTKQADKKIFFGLSCSAMSPFPLFQVLLFDDEIVSETPRFLKASYRLEGVRSDQKPVALQAILKSTLTADELSNKVRLELDPQAIAKDMRVMKEEYQRLLKQLESAKTIQIQLEHRSFGSRNYEFSLNGLKDVLHPYQSICR